MHHSQEVFDWFKGHNFKLHLDKCYFFSIEVEYMGYMINFNGLGVQKAKFEAISQVPQPSDIK
jgi:hypothetical protein